MLIRGAAAIMTGLRGAAARADGPDIRVTDGTIAAIGRLAPQPGERIYDATDCVVYPGWVNTHHHLFQSLLKGVPAGINLPLVEWLAAVPVPYRRFIDEEMLRLAATIGIAELLLSGCTTVADHHYGYWPRMPFDASAALFDVAERLGVRFALARGGATRMRGEIDRDAPPQATARNARWLHRRRGAPRRTLPSGGRGRDAQGRHGADDADLGCPSARAAGIRTRRAPSRHPAAQPSLRDRRLRPLLPGGPRHHPGRIRRAPRVGRSGRVVRTPRARFAPGGGAPRGDGNRHRALPAVELPARKRHRAGARARPRRRAGVDRRGRRGVERGGRHDHGERTPAGSCTGRTRAPAPRPWKTSPVEPPAAPPYSFSTAPGSSRPATARI